MTEIGMQHGRQINYPSVEDLCSIFDGVKKSKEQEHLLIDNTLLKAFLNKILNFNDKNTYDLIQLQELFNKCAKDRGYNPELLPIRVQQLMFHFLINKYRLGTAKPSIVIVFNSSIDGLDNDGIKTYNQYYFDVLKTIGEELGYPATSEVNMPLNRVIHGVDKHSSLSDLDCSSEGNYSIPASINVWARFINSSDFAKVSDSNSNLVVYI